MSSNGKNTTEGFTRLGQDVWVSDEVNASPARPDDHPECVRYNDHVFSFKQHSSCSTFSYVILFGWSKRSLTLGVPVRTV